MERIYTLSSINVFDHTMVNPEVEELLKDAENLYQEALKDLKARRIRKAAENAWCATAKATDALLLVRAKVEIVKGVGRTKEIYKLAKLDPQIRELNLAREYILRRDHLHRNCFYEGIYEIPEVDLKGLIVETKEYINNIRSLSQTDK